MAARAAAAHTSAAVHALVGDGHHGRNRLQDVCCQACGTTVSARRDTALYRLTTPAAQVSRVLTALAEGLDQRAASRVVGPGGYTLARWLTRSGEHAERRHALSGNRHRVARAAPVDWAYIGGRRWRLTGVAGAG